MNKNIAILGAAGHIAKGLIVIFSGQGNCNLFLFSRAGQKIRDFISNHQINNVLICNYSEFEIHSYNIIINCVGAGTPEKVEELGKDIFRITQDYDGLVIDYLKKKPDTKYFYLSSGVVHLPHLQKYTVPEDAFSLDISHVDPTDYYGLAKICAEKRHRSLSQLRIIDIRVFAYFSRFIDLNSRFLLTSLVDCALKKMTFLTHPKNIVRDYIHPFDLYAFINSLAKSSEQNMAVDIYSKSPVTKFELLAFFKEKYGLDYTIEDDFSVTNPTGEKDEFYPHRRNDASFDYVPKYSSLEAIEAELIELKNNL